MKPFNKQSIKLHEQEFFPFNFFLQLMIKSIWNDKYTNILWNNQLESEILCCNHSLISTMSNAIECLSNVNQESFQVLHLPALLSSKLRVSFLSSTDCDLRYDAFLLCLKLRLVTGLGTRPPETLHSSVTNSDLIKSSQRYKKMSGKIEIILLYTNTIEPYHLKLYSSKKISYIR